MFELLVNLYVETRIFDKKKRKEWKDMSNHQYRDLGVNERILILYSRQLDRFFAVVSVEERMKNLQQMSLYIRH